MAKDHKPLAVCAAEMRMAGHDVDEVAARFGWKRKTAFDMIARGKRYRDWYRVQMAWRQRGAGHDSYA